MSALPPRWSRQLLALAAKRLQTPDLVDDVDEVFDSRVAARGLVAARRWYRAQVRAALWRCLPGLPSGLSLDARLGLRMLRRYPGLTLVGGLAMAFAIFVGAVTFEFIRQTLPGRDLPIPDGDRVVGLRLWDRAANRPVQPTWADITIWRQSASSIQHLGAYLTVTRQVEGQNGQGRHESIALMTPEGFELAGMSPVVGRTFTARDVSEHGGALIVIGHQVWQTLFDGRPDVVGQTVTVGRVRATVMGVMPAGFKFPLNHSFWMPLTREAAGDTPLRTFARLDEGRSIAHGQEELEALLTALPSHQARPDLRPRVQFYRESLFDTPLTLLIRVLTQQLNIFAGLFVTLVAANIALLMYARAASRERELLVRVALGASRRRIVTQFLVETSFLFGGATLLGLATAGPGLGLIERRIHDMGGGTSPFWFSASVSGDTVVYALILMLFAVLLSGGLPALRATAQLSTARINGATSGAGRLHLGGIWRLVIVGQVAATVLFVAGATLMWRQANRSGSVDAAFPASDYQSVRIGIDRSAPAAEQARRLRLMTETTAQVPGVRAVTLADRLPMMTHGAYSVDVGGRAGSVSMARVDARFFEVFGAPLVSGRLLTDADAGHSAVVVDEAFVRDLIGPGDALGRQIVISSTDEGGPSEAVSIVGVVRSLEHDRPGRLYLDDQARPFIYQLLDTRTLPSVVHMAVHVPQPIASFAASLRGLAVEHDDLLELQEIESLDTVVRAEAAFWRLWAELIVLTSVVTLVLALAGVYAVMSFTVTRRTREIGIRLALGARSHRLVFDVLRSPIRQVGAGLVFGSAAVSGLCALAIGGLSAVDVVALGVFGLVVAMVCAVACVGPISRVLSVQPTTALASGD